ncbi:GTP pyrophosphokinase [Xylocopilactobacillus apicola]|uniref:GTP pyrophosphokinase n=1 Tax=Xylocopilactobacillus apicola TaxID=2932184 RepID=A0AAU9D2K6_9LACO|nr:GTP pyrophosphokinase family protein [Xylocopilactobacillus apicola]BDR59016.1 GTP pyrophosphokinase [Xylocopilactobacillus apicola]
MKKDWDAFLTPYAVSVEEMKVKLRELRKQYLQYEQESPIEFVTGRVKPVSSIMEKMQRRHIDEEHLEIEMQDIAGLRVVVQFVEDIYEVVELIRRRSDMTIVEERDYVKYHKASGYRSYHIVVEYMVELVDGPKKILAEIQVRTMSMNFWATIEHSLNYKYQGQVPPDVAKRLERSAEVTFELDQEMSEIRSEIRETDRWEQK